MNNVSLCENIIDSIDNVASSLMDAQIYATSALLQSYQKTCNILESNNWADDVSAQLFQEMFFLEAKSDDPEQLSKDVDKKLKESRFRKYDENGQMESMFISIIKFIPRLVQLIIEKIGDFIKKISHKRELEEARKTKEWLDKLDDDTIRKMDKEWKDIQEDDSDYSERSDEDDDDTSVKNTKTYKELRKRNAKLRSSKATLFNKFRNMVRKSQAEINLSEISNYVNKKDRTGLQYRIHNNTLKVPINFSAVNSFVDKYMDIVEELDYILKPDIEMIDFKELRGLHIQRYDTHFYSLKEIEVVEAIEEANILEDKLIKLQKAYKKVYPKTTVFRETKLWYQKFPTPFNNVNRTRHLQRQSGGQSWFDTREAVKAVQNVTDILNKFISVIPDLFTIMTEIREAFKTAIEVPKLAQKAIEEREEREKEERDEEEYEKEEKRRDKEFEREEKRKRREFERDKRDAERDRELRKIKKDDNEKDSDKKSKSKGKNSININIGDNGRFEAEDKDTDQEDKEPDGDE